LPRNLDLGDANRANQGQTSMNRLQVIALGVSALAFGGAYFVFNAYLGSQRKAPIVMQEAPKIDLDKVMVAAQDIPIGSVLNEPMIVWQDWPKAAISEQMLTKSLVPDTAAELKDTMTREGFMRGEPIRRDKLVKAGIGGYMAAVLPSDMRAVAIKIDNSGDSSAGGFILPNDHVDVVRIYRDDEGTRHKGQEVLGHQVILSNVRVLAIGQNVQEVNGRNVIAGGNATLELDPKQAEIVIYAQHLAGSSLNLVLRSLVDSAGATDLVNDPSDTDSNSAGIAVVRYGR
jgi:pilus assembly protein CpaB